MKSSNIGGQAVLEGIMMKHNEEYAVAVRKPDGEISVKKEKYHSIVKWKVLTTCLLYTSPSPRDRTRSRMPSSA